MSEEITKVKSKISNAKRKISNFSRFIENYNAVRVAPVLEKRKQDIDNVYLDFETFYSELELLAEDPSHAAVRTEYEEKYYAAYSKAASFLNVASSQANNSLESSSSGSSQSTVREISTNQLNTTNQNLPRVSLPSFSGSYQSWINFHDLFKSLVHDNDSIPDI